MKFQIRRATPDDATAACDVLKESITKCCIEDHQNNEEILSSWLSNKTPENIRSWFGSRGYAIVAVSEVEIIGVAMLGGNGRIVLCYILPKVRFQGIGQALLTELEDEARRRGLPTVALESTKTALSFYEKNGYVQSGTEQSPLGLTGFLMSKNLKKE